MRLGSVMSKKKRQMDIRIVGVSRTSISRLKKYSGKGNFSSGICHEGPERK
jgi:hypothetical protein